MANISLTKQQEKFIKDHVKSGRYLTASEVVRDALRELELRERGEQEKLEQLRKEVQLGMDDVRAGRVVDASTVFREARKRVKDER